MLISRYKSLIIQLFLKVSHFIDEVEFLCIKISLDNHKILINIIIVIN